MIVTRGKRPERDFAIINNALLRDARLSFRARGVLCFILSFSDGYQISAERLCEDGREGRDAIRSAFVELELAGYMVRTRKQGIDGRWESTATVSDEPKTDFQSSVNPAPVSRQSVYQALKEDHEENHSNTIKKESARAKKSYSITFNRATGDFSPIPAELAEKWKKLYPLLNIETELTRASCWLLTNPARQKEDYPRFLNGWMGRNKTPIPQYIPTPKSAKEQNRAYMAAIVDKYAVGRANNKPEKGNDDDVIDV